MSNTVNQPAPHFLVYPDNPPEYINQSKPQTSQTYISGNTGGASLASCQKYQPQSEKPYATDSRGGRDLTTALRAPKSAQAIAHTRVPTNNATIGAQYQAELYARCAHGDHQYETKFGPCGIITAICCFPIGLICLCMDKERQCSRCGTLA